MMEDKVSLRQVVVPETGGVFVVAWFADNEGYVVCSSEGIIMYPNGRESSAHFGWFDLELKEFKWEGKDVVITLKVTSSPDKTLILTLDGSRGGANVLAYVLGKFRG